MAEESQLKYIYDLIAYQGKTLGDKPYILFEDRQVSFDEYNRATCRAANGLKAQGAQPGDGMSILMGNCPEYLFLFYGLPRGGFYSVPVNVALKGEGLAYILENSDVKYLAVDDALYPKFVEIGRPIESIKKVFIRRTTDAPLPAGTMDLAELLDASDEQPDHGLDPEAVTHLMYTSGTTGFPKGVVNRIGPGGIDRMIGLAKILTLPTDILYTALPLFHANALNLTAGFALAAGLPFGLDKKFSASRFWDRIRFYGASQFNGLGAMIPILMKQPEKPDDADNPVRLVISAACPANLWEAFEKRFNLKIWEAYGAVDGGGLLIFNFGNAPVGSVGKVMGETDWKLIDDEGNEVPQGEIGELVTRSRVPSTRVVEYYKNPEASNKKVRDGWVYSGDYFYADQEGNLYFTDRKTDSMRRRGENISSFEVESIIEKYPEVEVCAAFGVPSELGEDEVMIWVVPKPGARLDLKDLIRYCARNMAYFMVPRYIDIVDEIPRTETLRIIKTQMKKQGVTERTWDREKEMPDLKLK
ncbi:MAG: AMP-binding protein [Deltaproteobacteria bacterium]|nr:AMP-binding protein [Deltaproteobacteria bacterium]